jgi:hypothetical protein
MGVTTVSIPYAALLAEGDKVRFFEELNKLCEIAYTANMFRVERFKKTKAKQNPIFNDVMANDIRMFLKKIKEKHPDDFTLIVHCHAGVSRSAAIGRYAFEELLNGTFAEFEFQNPYTAYNPIVYQKLKELPL